MPACVSSGVTVNTMNENLTKIVEWAFWANLESESNVELILLKGHLFMEVLLNYVLAENGLKTHTNYSFYRKVHSLLLVTYGQTVTPNRIAPYLFRLNNLRNNLAHDFSYDITNGDIEKWSLDVLAQFDVVKNTRYTFRTRIVHAFAALARALGEIRIDTTIRLEDTDDSQLKPSEPRL